LPPFMGAFFCLIDSRPTSVANMPSSIVTKPPKPSFVGFGSTYPGALGFFGLSSYRFLRGGFYRAGIFLR
jgi:hypothetical protein